MTITPNKLWAALFCAGGLIAAYPPPACAGPPLVTDDPGTAGEQTWVVNLAHTMTEAPALSRTEAPFVEVNRGLRANDELTLSFSVVEADSETDESHWGVSDLEFAYKCRFLEEDKHSFAASVAPKLFAPTGNANIGVGGGQTQFFLPLQAGRHWFEEKLYVYGELAYQFGVERHAADFWFSGVAAEWQATENTTALFEVAEIAVHAGADDVFFNMGVTHVISEHVSFIGSAGRSFRSEQRAQFEFASFIGRLTPPVRTCNFGHFCWH